MSTSQFTWSHSRVLSTDPTSTLLSQFPSPPSSSTMQTYPTSPCQPTSTPVMMISLGEEYTDETLPTTQSSYLSMDDEDEEMDYDEDTDSDEETYSPITPSSTATHKRSSIPALWHAEHSRLVNLQNAVLDNERAARSRELKLESEVARIKEDLARLKTRAHHPTSSSSSSSASSLPASSSTNSSLQAPSQPRACGPRGPRPRPQQSQRPTSLVDALDSRSSDSRQPSTSAATIISQEHDQSNMTELAPPSLLGKLPFEEDDDTTETVLSNHLTEARSARAQERQRRKKENERIRELSMLLTLGSEVRKWEERLAWQQARSVSSTASSDDMEIESTTKSSNRVNDTDPDPRGKRLSRSFSLPSRGSYMPTPGASTSTSSSSSNRSGPPSPALPSLSLSPLWRVSAEMILRRRHTERPRRIPPRPLLSTAAANLVEQQDKPQQPQPLLTAPICSTSKLTGPSGTLTRPVHVLRGPREQRSGNSISSDLASAPTTVSSDIISPLGMNASGVSSGSSTPSSGKRYCVPPPITIPSNSQFCSMSTATATTTSTGAGLRLAGQQPSAAMANNNNGGGVSLLLSKTTPVKGSALKWAFTADDLAREMELEAQKCRADSSSSSSSSSSESESDDSGKSSSSSSSSSSSQEASQCVERRGRARFSWRRSLPKDGNNTAQLNTIEA